MKKVVYSCLFSKNKRVDEPRIVDKLDGWDYFMFTNTPERVNGSGWNSIHKDLMDDHPIYTAKYYKWIAHKYLLDYDIAIYVDAYMSPNTMMDWGTYISKLNENDTFNGIILNRHQHRGCIYQECEAISHCRKDTKENMNKVINFLKENGMPSNYGLCSCGLFIRHLKNNGFNKLCDELFELMLKFTYRDQALISYIFWKNNVKINSGLTNDFYRISGKMGDHIYI